MRVALANDQAGFERKRDLAAFLEKEGHEVIDLGTDSHAPVDYPALAEDFRFFSPPDPGLDEAQYFERCWPNTQVVSIDLERLIEVGSVVVATYSAQTGDGKRFRNTEVFAFEGDRLKQVRCTSDGTCRGVEVPVAIIRDTHPPLRSPCTLSRA